MCIKSFFRKGYDNLKFTALEVRYGDAFLLEKGDWKCLYDAGINQIDVVSQLKRKKIYSLNLAICSHNDKDHTTGFIGLLSSKIKIDEIWLPGLWANILQFIIDRRKTGNICYEIEKYIDSLDADKLKKIKNESNMDALFGDETVSDDELKKHITDYLDGFDDYLKSQKIKPKHSLKIAFNNIIKIASLAYHKGCKIKWFEPVYGCPNLPVDHGFWALNSYPISQIFKIKSITKVIQAIYLTTVNRYSLAFEYYHNDIPVVRFSADSNCICQTVKLYTKNIIITAPHHGSKDNAAVYDNIKGSNIIWIRSDSINNKRPCDKFKALPYKCCLRCKSTKRESEIIFEYQNNTWNHKKGIICGYTKC